MNQNEQLIKKFYDCFGKRDWKGMLDCYHEEIFFYDPVFQNLEGAEVRAMWEMLLRNAKDLQVTAIRGARAYLGDRLTRVAAPHRLLDPKAGPLIAVKLNILTRKSLGGLQTDLSGRVLRADGEPLPGLYAAGEVAGFGGGGMHGYRSLEGTFLGGCLFSGRNAGRAAAKAAS